MINHLCSALLVGAIACASQSALAQDKPSGKQEATKSGAKSSADKDADKTKADKQGEEKGSAKKKRRPAGCG